MTKTLGWVAILCWLPVQANAVETSNEQPNQQIQSAQAVVAALHQGLLDMMPLDDRTARKQHIEPTIRAHFDLERIATVSLGNQWHVLNSRRQAEFCDLLGKVIAATYADRFYPANGQSFSVREVKKARAGQVVRTRLHTATGNVVDLDYYLTEQKIFNIAANGVSDLSVASSGISSDD